MTADEMLALLGHVPTMSDAALAMILAMPGGNEPFEAEDEQPALGPDGEPIYPGDSGSL
jgi:hypothetical protein